MKLIIPNPELARIGTFGIALVAARIFVTQSVFYGFLIFNLVLAAVPYLISGILRESANLSVRGLLCVSLLWLVFLPNSPYIVTDLLHFSRQTNMPAWYDVLMLATCATAGMALGVVSLLQMAEIWMQRFGPGKANTMAFLSCIASGAGMYIGRFIRYNSWDILHHPARLSRDVLQMTADPSAMLFSACCSS